MDAFEVLFLGTRGSIPVEGPQYAQYGGATSCVLVRVAGQVLVLDAGSGFALLSDVLHPEETSIHLLLSHAHLDHLLGLPMADFMFRPQNQVAVYGATRGGMPIQEQVDTLMRPPIWPVPLSVLGADVTFHPLEDLKGIEDLRITTLEGNHPGGVTAFRMEYQGISVVYATDYEIDETSIQPLIEFARGCTLLICDGQYDEAVLSQYKGFGHSSWAAAAKVATRAGATQLRVFHHDIRGYDSVLNQAQTQIQSIFPGAQFAKCGEVIAL